MKLLLLHTHTCAHMYTHVHNILIYTCIYYHISGSDNPAERKAKKRRINLEKNRRQAIKYRKKKKLHVSNLEAENEQLKLKLKQLKLKLKAYESGAGIRYIGYIYALFCYMYTFFP